MSVILLLGFPASPEAGYITFLQHWTERFRQGRKEFFYFTTELTEGAEKRGLIFFPEILQIIANASNAQHDVFAALISTVSQKSKYEFFYVNYLDYVVNIFFL